MFSIVITKVKLTYFWQRPAAAILHCSRCQKNIIGLNNEKLISVDDKLFRVLGPPSPPCCLPALLPPSSPLGCCWPLTPSLPLLHLQMIRDTWCQGGFLLFKLFFVFSLFTNILLHSGLKSEKNMCNLKKGKMRKINVF